MPIPSGATVWAQPLDPSDRADYVVGLGALFTGEEVIDVAQVTLMPEAVALGLTILEDEDHGPSIADDTNIELWFEVEEEFRDNVLFLGGVDLPVEITVTTTATPPRRFQRTVVLKVVQL
jgi:hypothetical protein